MTWKTPTDRDHCEWNLNKVEPCDRDVWRSSVRSAMHAASQLPGKEPIDLHLHLYVEPSNLTVTQQVMWMMLLHLHFNVNADDDDNLSGNSSLR